MHASSEPHVWHNNFRWQNTVDTLHLVADRVHSRLAGFSGPRMMISAATFAGVAASYWSASTARTEPTDPRDDRSWARQRQLTKIVLTGGPGGALLFAPYAHIVQL